MNFRPYLVEKILAGEKTQTRRPVKENEITEHDQGRIASVITVPRAGPDMTRYKLGKDYAVCPGMGKPAVARIRITGIRFESVYEISEADARAEGFASPFAFWIAWAGFYVPKAVSVLESYRAAGQMATGPEDYAHALVMARSFIAGCLPSHKWNAWALTFEVVK